jgi:hypothetical protein
MAILIDSVEFTDKLGKVTSFYESNAGDEVTAVLSVRGLIRMSSVGNPLTLDPTTNQVQSTQSWLDQGFRPNQWVYVVIYASGGSVLNSFWSFTSYVDDLIIDLGAVPDWYSITNQEIVTLTAVVAQNDTNALPFDQLDVLLNHSQNGSPFTPFSQIDGEVTRARMTGISGLSVGASLSGIAQGYQSGQFLLDSSITRVTGVDQFFKYEVSITFINSGMYDSSWFFSSDCLKAGISTEWAVIAGEPYNRLTGTYSLDADTGYFDEPFNTGLLDATLVQGLAEIDYCVPTTGDIIVDGPVTDIGIGSCYLSIDDTYYKNKLESQTALTMVIPTTAVVASTTYNSAVNPSGASYDITVNSVNSVGTVTTINVTITPNANFQTFIDGRDSVDRRFLLWVRCGNLNLLAHDAQLVCDPPVGGPLIMEQSYAFLDHSENVQNTVLDFTGFECNIEDDIAYVGRFLLDKNQTVESFSIKMEAYNSVTLDDFTLQQVTFGFSTVPISNDGRYLLNETQTIINTLPNTSEKLNAVLDLDASLDTPTQYGVRIFAPWLINWKYWVALLSASVDFYPNQNQNWEQYDNLLADWTVRLELSLVIDGLSYTHTEPINIKGYDSDEDILQTIELYIDSSNTLVEVVTEGELMRVVATHKLLNGTVWDQSDVWGMITVEPYEAERRWILSTVVPYDNNLNNPLYPLSGLLMDITYPAPNVARMECYFNPDLIDLSNGVKFTTKIKDNCRSVEVTNKTMTDGTVKTTTTGDNKTIAN